MYILYVQCVYGVELYVSRMAVHVHTYVLSTIEGSVEKGDK